MKAYTGRIVIRFAVFFLIALFCALAIHVLRQNTLQNAQHVGMVMTSNYASEVRRNLLTMENQLNYGAGLLNSLVPHADEQQLTETALRFMVQAREVMQGRVILYLIGEDGRIMISSGSEQPMEDFNVSSSPWYARTLAGDSSICYTDVYRDRITGRAAITISKKFKDSNYVLAYDLFPGTFNFYFDKELLQTGDSFFFTDSRGRLLYASTDLRKPSDELQGYVRWLVTAIRSGKCASYEDFITDLDGRRRAVYYTQLQNGWYSIVTVPHVNIVRDVDILNGVLGVGMLIFLGAIVFFSWREMNARKLMERSIETVRVLGNHYAAIYRINYEQNTYEMIKGSEYVRSRLPAHGSYDDLRNVVIGYFEPGGVQAFWQNFSTDNIRKLVQQKVRNFAGDFQRLVNGVYRWTTVYLLFDDSLEEGEVVLCFRDVEEEKVKEQRERQLLQDSLEISRQSDKSKQVFFSNVSHEMRTPLSAIIGMCDLAITRLDMQEKNAVLQATKGVVPVGEDRDRQLNLRRCLEQIRFSSRQMKHLIDDILEFSRLDQGKFSLNNEPINLWQCLSTAVAPYALQAAADKKHFTFTMEKDSQMVLGDPMRLAQIMNNLISNAFKFTAEGGHIDVVAERIIQVGAVRYRISVTDDGAGMSRDFLSRVFVPYSRDNSFAARQTAGTGLGMPITRTLVEQMNGEISVQSEEGVGTTFTVVLPFVLAKTESPGTEVQTREAGEAAQDRPEEQELAVLEGARVLLAEDNAINMELTTEVLAMQGMVVTQAWNGKEAVDIFSRSEPFHFAAILMDMRMPVMDGCEACRAIRALDREDAGLPIIAVTANAFAEDIVASTEAGMDAHVSKPIDIDQLTQLLARLMTKSRH